MNLKQLQKYDPFFAQLTLKQGVGGNRNPVEVKSFFFSIGIEKTKLIKRFLASRFFFLPSLLAISPEHVQLPPVGFQAQMICVFAKCPSLFSKFTNKLNLSKTTHGFTQHIQYMHASDP